MHLRSSQPRPKIPKPRYDTKLKRDPTRFRRKVLAELKRRDMTVTGAIERLLYLAVLKRAGTMPTPTGVENSDRMARNKAQRHYKKVLYRVANMHSVLCRNENLDQDRNMVGVRRLLHNTGHPVDELPTLLAQMRSDNVALPASAFDELDAYCQQLMRKKSSKPRRSPSGKLGRRMCSVARTLENHVSAEAAA